MLPEPWVLKYPDKLEALMEQNKLSYRTLADKARYGKTPLNELVTGKQKTISYPPAERIAKALNVPVSDLFRPKHLPEGD